MIFPFNLDLNWFTINFNLVNDLHNVMKIEFYLYTHNNNQNIHF